MTGLTIQPNIVFSINGNTEPLLEFRNNGDVYYNHHGDIKKVENGGEILDAFRYCVLGYTGKEPKDALFDNFLNKIDNNELSNKQITEIEKRIRKIKLNRLL